MLNVVRDEFVRGNNLDFFPNEFEMFEIPRLNELISLACVCTVDAVMVVVRLRVETGVVVRDRLHCERAAEMLSGVCGSWRVSTDMLATDELGIERAEDGASETADFPADTKGPFRWEVSVGRARKFAEHVQARETRGELRLATHREGRLSASDDDNSGNVVNSVKEGGRDEEERATMMSLVSFFGSKSGSCSAGQRRIVTVWKHEPSICP